MFDAGTPVPAGPYMLQRLSLTDSAAGPPDDIVQCNRLQAGPGELQVLCRFSAWLSTALARL